MKKINNKWYWCSGLLAVCVYLVAVIFGGLLYPGYSHISQDVSQLTSTSSPIRGLMNIFFIYNLLIMFFGYGLFAISKNNFLKVASGFIVLIGILGIVIAWFPINTRGTDITSTGIVHIAIVSVVSLLTVVSGFLFWAGFRRTNEVFLKNVSLLSGVLFLLSGPIAAFNVNSGFAGLFERIPIAIFLIWVGAVSAHLLKVSRTKPIN